MERRTRGAEQVEADLSATVRNARREGADTAGLDDALAVSNDSLAETRHMAEEADEHIRHARLAVDLDAELSPRRGHHWYDSGSEHPELDDQSIAPA